MKTRTLALAAAAALTTFGVVFAQTGWPAPWVTKQAPFRLIGDVYEVGSEGLTALLVKTPGGLVLLDAGMPSYAPQVAKNIEALGFKPRDVKLILNSHAHFDHAGGFAELKRLTARRWRPWRKTCPRSSRASIPAARTTRC